MTRFALLIAAAALGATPALAGNAGTARQPAGTGAALASGPGGCEGFNRALTEAVAAQVRIGRHAEARRLMGLFQPCPR
jgi:hypothetical protein